MADIIVALDGMRQSEAVQLAESLKEHVWGFKFNDLLMWLGTSVIHKFKRFGKVFADPKLNDIPETVANCVKRLVKAGADIITVHANGGTDMVRAAVDTAGSASIAAVTVLTSMTPQNILEIYDGGIGEVTHRLAKIARDGGAHGLVCSSLMCLEMARKYKEMFRVVPGIRPHGYVQSGNDRQVWTTSSKVDTQFIVVGRPISEAKDPVAAVKHIKELFE